MLTRSRTMAAPEAAGEIAGMERVSDTARPTTAVETAPNVDPTFGSLIEKQPVTSGDSSSGSFDQRRTNTIATNHEASPGSLVLASSALEPATRHGHGSIFINTAQPNVSNSHPTQPTSCC